MTLMIGLSGNIWIGVLSGDRIYVWLKIMNHQSPIERAIQPKLIRGNKVEENLLKTQENTRDLVDIRIQELTEINAKFQQEIHVLSQKITEIHQLNKQLEQLVQECCAQLTTSNYELQQEIHSRLLLEEKIRSSEAKMRGVFEAMTDIILVVDITGNIEVLPTNTAALYEAKFAPIGLTIEQFFLPENGELWWQQIRQVLETKETLNFDYNLLIDKEMLWFTARISPMSDNAVIWVSRDITERQKIERKLAESQRWLQAINESNPNILYVYDLLEKQNIYTNQEIYPMLGYTPKEIRGMRTAIGEMLLHPDDLPLVLEHEKRLAAAKDGEKFDVEYRQRHKNGEWRWLLSRETVFSRNTEGKPKQILGAATDISDRKKAEQALQESEARFDKLVSNIPGILYIFIQNSDDYNYFEYVSSAARELLEIEAELIIKNASFFFDLIHPADRSNYYQTVAHSAKTLAPFSYEWRIITPSGKIKWLQAKSRPERRHNGDLVWYGALFDISDREIAKEKLKKSETNLAVAQRIAHIGSWELNIKTGKITWSEELFDIFGLDLAKSEPTLGEQIQQIHPEDRACWQKIIDRTLATGKPYEIEFRILRPDGEVRYVEARGEGILNNSKQVSELLGTVMDITCRKQAEQFLRESAKREQAITKAIERMRQTLNLDVIFSATTEELRQVLKCDRAAIYRFQSDNKAEIVADSFPDGCNMLIEILGNSGEDNFENKLISADRFVPAEYLEKIKIHPYSSGASYLSIPDIYQAEVDLPQIRTLEKFQAKALAIVPIYQGKKLWGLLSVYQYSHIRRWEEAEINAILHISAQLEVALQQAESLAQSQRQSIELIKAKEAADAANKAKSQFLAKMSHELRTPLNAILGFSQILTRSDSLSKEQREYLAIVNRSGEHLLNLINDILSMAKIEAGQLTLNENYCDLYRMLNSIEEILQLKASAKGLRLKFELSSEVPRSIQTDESKLLQILLNLLGNAIKFTEKGSVILRIKVKYRDKMTCFLVFEIEDTGLGIAPEELSKLFQPFMQTQTGRQSMQGTGLGLSIAKQFVKLMGGDITVSSQISKGTTFTFDILVKLPSSYNQKIVSSTQRIIGLEPHQLSYRILIVEDVKENRQLLVKQLEPLGLELCEAENGQQAVALWESWQPHLIWMDMQMPVMDGYEATKRIKSQVRGEETVIIALTASAFEEQQSAILQAGCDDFVHKPFREEIIWEKIAKHLGVRYIYEKDLSGSSNHSELQPKSLTSEDLSVMPKEWLIQLHEAALSINDTLVSELIEQIPKKYGNLTKTLTDLVDNFRMDVIIELSQVYANESSK